MYVRCWRALTTLRRRPRAQPALPCSLAQTGCYVQVAGPSVQCALRHFQAHLVRVPNTPPAGTAGDPCHSRSTPRLLLPHLKSALGLTAPPCVCPPTVCFLMPAEGQSHLPAQRLDERGQRWRGGTARGSRRAGAAGAAPSAAQSNATCRQTAPAVPSPLCQPVNRPMPSLYCCAAPCQRRCVRRWAVAPCF